MMAMEEKTEKMKVLRREWKTPWEGKHGHASFCSADAIGLSDLSAIRARFERFYIDDYHKKCPVVFPFIVTSSVKYCK